ncbi:MAG: ATP-binding cassette, subfamily bacterial [Chthoniobacter sp.]|jgi:ATP-binding cassette subfamily B protein/subfamily B ATP-binding cassette protein MsbA|nr:ATP-binding cassette, subfamily bacterial [Chthoniobacter sp.]
MSIYRRALAYYRPFLRPTIVAVLLTLISIGLGLLRPWPFAYIVDHVLPAAAKGEEHLAVAGFDLTGWSLPSVVLLMCSLIILFHLLSGLLSLVTGVMFLRVGLHALLRIRTELYAYLHSLPLKFHDLRRSADSSFRVAYDSQSIQSFYSKAIFIFQACFSILSTFAVMWRLDSRLTLLSIAVIPFMVAAIYFFAKRIRAESTTIAERESAVLTVAQEGLSSIKMVQAFGREDFEVAQFRRSANESLEANLRLNFVSMKSSLVISTLIAISTAAMYYVGSRHVLEGSLKLGELIWISSLLLLLYQPLEALTQVAWALEGAAAGAQRCFEVLDHQDDVKDSPNAREIVTSQGEVVFENISFGYAADRPILSGVNLRVAPGQTVAFVGGTGAGKSTLLSLVPRFYDPTAGRMLLDGRDLREITKRSLRNQISIVLQDTLLFSTTIRENIAYGNPDATEEQVVEAAKRAQAHDFITAMTDGYRSQVGERGSHLSVGQRQRIGIARAFLKNAPILLLDEPTSALDPTTEAAIMHTIEELMRGRTTLIITHRIATVHGVEKIVVLANGGVVEEGRGPELVARGGFYAGLYRSANLGDT